MSFKRKKIEQTLTSKCAFRKVEEDSHHRYYKIKIRDVGLVTTRLSHSKKTVNKSVVGSIAKQIGVRTPFLNKLISCEKSAGDYYEKVQTDPHPLFNKPSYRSP